jgi:anaphase-promoting complex subunit 6
MVVRAERLYEQYFSDKACRLARKAYSLDPYNWRGLSIYIACLCDLEYKTELFYLSHELVESYPKKPLTWYAVGCYYWCCKKLELAHKFFLRATKLDKSFALAWVAVGVVLSAQEETEHALSAFRAACRLLPGQHMPMFFLAKELARTNNYALALQVLQGALEMSPDDAMVLNELGALYLQQHRFEEAHRHLSRAAQPLRSSKALRSPHDYVVLSNMGTCLRKLGRLVEALEWYSLALSDRAGDASTHANIGYTLHLQGDLGAAIESYHRALSLDPSLSFCSEMLNRAMDDVDSEYSTTAVGEDCRLVNQSSAMEDSASSSIFTPFSQRLGF